MEGPDPDVGQYGAPDRHCVRRLHRAGRRDHPGRAAADRCLGVAPTDRAKPCVGDRLGVSAGDENAGQVGSATPERAQGLLGGALGRAHKIGVGRQSVPEAGHGAILSPLPVDVR